MCEQNSVTTYSSPPRSIGRRESGGGRVSLPPCTLMQPGDLEGSGAPWALNATGRRLTFRRSGVSCPTPIHYLLHEGTVHDCKVPLLALRSLWRHFCSIVLQYGTVVSSWGGDPPLRASPPRPPDSWGASPPDFPKVGLRPPESDQILIF